MAITLYRAPNCIRCRITHEFMDAKGISYGSYDLEADKDIVNGFYRANRKFLHRNETGVEFPMFHDDDGDVVLQGTGVIIAYLLSGKALGESGAVSESKMLHGWISGLNVSKVPAGEEEHFAELVTALAKGGLQVVIDSDGRNADLLEKLINTGCLTRVRLNIPGPASVYPAAAGGEAPSKEELGKSIALARAFKDNVIRLYLEPIPQADGSLAWLSPADAALAGKMVAEACNDMMLPFGIQAGTEPVKGLEPLANLLPYRSKVRAALPKTDIIKGE
ncbi:hypothetical protein [Mailhella massiliensis]|uniref:GST N-terminal domain-containing protein n=1 Tax=Mailhella massiliensis TaxID=1903261 RepID=A0A921DR24_9BACT|nr:hypothetical protein [Mailhella massiliensis]HJD97220.1 hypothetical protein [Mailhella massiliensis]